MGSVPNYSVISNPAKLSPIYPSGWNHRINLEGVLSYSGGRSDKSNSYVQLYRNGIIEGYMLGDRGENKYIPSKIYERKLIQSLGNFLDLAKELGVNMPVVIFLTLIGVKDYEMAVDRSQFLDEYYKIDRDVLTLPETIVESYDIDPKDILRPMFDLVWNACGGEIRDSAQFTQ